MTDEERDPTVREIIAELREAIDGTCMTQRQFHRVHCVVNKLEFAYNTEELFNEERYTLTDLGAAYHRAMSGKLGGVKAGDE